MPLEKANYAALRNLGPFVFVVVIATNPIQFFGR